MGKQFTINTTPVYDTIASATQEAGRKTYSEQAQEAYKEANNTSGRKGVKMARINMAFTPSNYDYIKTMARVSGMTLTDYVNAIIRKHKSEHEEQYQNAVDIRENI